MKRNARKRRSSESGGAFVEATIALPLFLAMLLFSVYLLYFSFKLLRFQYGLSEATRETFTKKRIDRGDKNWDEFLLDQMKDVDGTKWNLPGIDLKQARFLPCAETHHWDCAGSAKPGDTFLIQYEITDRLLGDVSIAGIYLPSISFQAKAVATIQMSQNE